jgi:hypothetical protein
MVRVDVVKKTSGWRCQENVGKKEIMIIYVNGTLVGDSDNELANVNV